MFVNPLYLLLLLPAALGWYAQVRVQTAYQTYGHVPNKYGLTCSEIAEQLAAFLGLEGLTLH
ncbi:MAG: zinc metallopeptidase [Anaerolineae bacterium]